MKEPLWQCCSDDHNLFQIITTAANMIFPAQWKTQIYKGKMWWYFTFSTVPGGDWEWAPKSKNSQKEVTSPQDKELFKLQGSFQKNTRSQKPEFSQEGSFQYKTEFGKIVPFVLIVMSWWCSWSKIPHLQINSLFFPRTQVADPSLLFDFVALVLLIWKRTIPWCRIRA